MIAERTLRNWRKDALRDLSIKETKMPISPEQLNIDVLYRAEMNNRILRLTQALLDMHLMKGIKA